MHDIGVKSNGAEVLNRGRLDRREFGERLVGAALGWLLVSLETRSTSADTILPAEASEGGPVDPPWRTVMVSPREPGEPLVVSGTVYRADGTTPVEGARLYVYHTDAAGLYSPKGARFPRLRGWMKTRADGRYEFRTIRPAAYPGRTIPAHTHATLSAPGMLAEWIDDYWFDGDPYLARAERAKSEGRGPFAPILKLERRDGVWFGVRDIRL